MASRKNDWKNKLPGLGPGNGKNQKNQGPEQNGFQFKIPLGYITLMILLVSLFNYVLFRSDNTVVPYSMFKQKVESGEIRRVEMDGNYYTGYAEALTGQPASPLPATAKGGAIYKAVPIADPDFTRLLDSKGVVYSASPREGNAVLSFVFNWLLPFGAVFFVWRMIGKRMNNTGNVLAFGQNKASIVAEGDIQTRFNDVAGVDEAKYELEEVVDFLKNPRKYTDIGGKIPKGVLLVGPPGTGKTLLARAVAGEAGVPFFRMSGSEFVEMFVGVGAARVRDLFKQARQKAPCIIFIDELDALGKSRSSGVMGGNDEREQTLNQLLIEMDGFDATSGLILVAATNRPDVLDPALMRPGRFDRQVLVDRPDLIGREAILSIHSKGVKLEDGVDVKKIARGTPGFVGADLANLVNEAALLAVRAGRKKVSHADFEAAIEKIVAGLEKKSKVVNPVEKKTVAWHESGHAIVAAFTEGADPVRKISIIPRGLGALGYTLQLPLEDRYIVSESELLGQIDVLMGGRAAEQIALGSVSTGASNDIARATEIAKRMITDYGMSERFRNVALSRRALGQGHAPEPSFSREYSEETQRYVDEEIARILSERYARALQVLESKRSLLDRMAEFLLEKEVLDECEFRAMIENASVDGCIEAVSSQTADASEIKKLQEKSADDQSHSALPEAPGADMEETVKISLLPGDIRTA